MDDYSNVNLPQAWVISALLSGEVEALVSAGIKLSKFSEPYRSVYEWAMEYISEYQTFPTVKRVEENFDDVLIPDWDGRPVGDVLDRFYEDLNQRLLRAAVVEVGNSVAANDGKALDLWYQWNERISGEISQTQVVSWQSTADDRFGAYIDNIQKSSDGEEVGTGIMTGIKHIDNLTYGILPGNLVLILGRFDTGKTTLMTQFMVSAAKTNNLSLVISPEHSPEEMQRKIDAMYMHYDPLALRRGSLDLDLIKDLKRYRDEIKSIGGDIKVIGGAGRRVEEIGAYAKALQPDIIFVDGISHLKGSQGESDWLKLGMMSYKLKELASNTGIPVVTVVQESKESKGVNSIARSDMIGRAADIIIHIEKVTDMRIAAGLVKYRETKNRGGKVYLDLGELGLEFIEVDEVDDGYDGFDLF